MIKARNAEVGDVIETAAGDRYVVLPDRRQAYLCGTGGADGRIGIRDEDSESRVKVLGKISWCHPAPKDWAAPVMKATPTAVRPVAPFQFQTSKQWARANPTRPQFESEGLAGPIERVRKDPGTSKPPKKGKCFNCAKKLTDMNYCYGCEAFVCDACSICATPFYAHAKERHIVLLPGT
jgi:hypothetical protein